MKQLQFTFKDDESLNAALDEIRRFRENNTCYGLFIQIFTEILDREKIQGVCSRIDQELPDAAYAGCSSNGNIIRGDFSGGSMAMICSFFEYPTTKVELFQYKLTAETQVEVAGEVIQEIKKRDWVKGAEFLTTIREMSMTALCEELSRVREDVELFGGGAFAADINVNQACVFSKKGGYQEKSIVFIFFGGEDLHIHTSFMTGWKPLGTFLKVTSADGCILRELNGKPAYQTYEKYLHIQNDEHFFFNTLEFPFMYRHYGIDIMRAPIASNPDGSLTMTSDIQENVMARLAYGDPLTILESARNEAEKMKRFEPEAIIVFSCAGRRTFWGNEEIGRESADYQKIAPTSGFYTSSEFLRTEGHLHQHNVTQVIAAFREGDQSEDFCRLSEDLYDDHFKGKVSMVSRMASFIKATMEELEEANKQLSAMAITDGLTGIYNRSEIQRRITEEIDIKKTEPVYLIMLDLDDFKHVNDVCGHKEGDNVLIRVSGLMKEAVVAMEGKCDAGRWGGEEFMILLHSVDRMKAMEQAEKIRHIMAGISFEKAGTVTISIGVIQVRPNESADAACMRVDETLYEAKRRGKNRVVFLP